MVTAEEALSKERTQRVLSIQSHVVHGYAGNKCSVFPLQLHGFEVDFINSVQFSNHTGYEHLTGQRLTDVELASLYDGLKKNDINKYSHILTGYCGNVNFLRKVADIVADLKMKDPNTLFVCDPVMGDNGKYYVPKELLPIYKDFIIPLADVLTPNAFELGELMGMKIFSEADCMRGIDAMHERGVRVVVVTSGVEGAQPEDRLMCYASTRGENVGEKKVYRFDFPRVPGHFVGTGDVFASLLVVWLTEKKGEVASAVGKVLGSMQGLLMTTYEQSKGSKSNVPTDLRLVQAREALLIPPENFLPRMIFCTSQTVIACSGGEIQFVKASSLSCSFDKEGGSATVDLTSSNFKRMVFKVQTTNVVCYKFSQSYGFIDALSSMTLTIRRLPGEAKEDTAFICCVLAPDGEEDAKRAFVKTKSEEQTVEIILKAE